MTSTVTTQGNDLIITRLFDAPPQAVWDALTDAESLKRWFVPRPWTIPHAVIEPHPGGRFLTEMRGPEGQDEEDGPAEGCVLMADPPGRLVWTDALSGGFRPNPAPFMTADITLAPEGGGTRYTARILHADAAARQRHEEMGFADGWGTVLEQLAEALGGSS